MSERRSWDLRLGYLIHDVSRLRRVCFDRELAPLGITRSQWWVVAFVSRNDGLTQTQLANELDVGKVALGALIERLEASGFVERRTLGSDRRVKRVFLTEKADKFIVDLIPTTESFNERILEGIPRKDLEVTAKTLYAMKKNLIALLSEPEEEEAEEQPAPRRSSRAKERSRRMEAESPKASAQRATQSKLSARTGSHGRNGGRAPIRQRRAGVLS